MDSVTQGAIEKWFEKNKEPMEVDVVTDGVGVVRTFSDIYEILSEYDENGFTQMYFPI